MDIFWRYIGNSILKPYDSFIQLNADPKGLKQGARAILLIGALYTLTVTGLAIAEADISSSPWLAIPAGRYYFWEIFFALPVFLLSWILVSGLIQVLSRGFHGQGSFENTLAAIGFALTIPTFVTWIPETIGTLLFLTGAVTQVEWREAISRPGFWQTFANIYQFVALGWMLLLIPLAIAIVQKIRWWQAAIIGTISLVLFMTVMLVFIR